MGILYYYERLLSGSGTDACIHYYYYVIVAPQLNYYVSVCVRVLWLE